MCCDGGAGAVEQAPGLGAEGRLEVGARRAVDHKVEGAVDRVAQAPVHVEEAGEQGHLVHVPTRLNVT